MKCAKCGWEGEASELIDEPTDLKLNDHFDFAIFIMATKRRTFLCPVCRTPFQTAKFRYGMENEREDLQEERSNIIGKE
jgi:hypothetical protein